MKARQAAYLVAGLFLTFAAWEAVQHVWLMDLPMAAYHTMSLIVDLVLVLIIALAALAIVRHQAHHEARQHAVQDAVTVALSEDLRPPLLSLMAQLQALRSAPPERAGEEMGELVRQAEARAGVLLQTIDDLVAMARERDRPAPRCSGMSVGQLAEQAVEAARPAAEGRGVGLEAEVAPSLPRACAAPDAVLRALSSLLERAVNATPRGGEVRIQVTPDPPNRLVVIAVSDTAEPLLDHPADLDEVMARHRLVELRYVQALAAALDGSVRYEPKPDGNVFTVSLPARGTAR
jgi:two-component system OmpR family sensor kinase